MVAFMAHVRLYIFGSVKYHDNKVYVHTSKRAL